MRLPRYEYRAETFKMNFQGETSKMMISTRYAQDGSFKMILSRRVLQGEISKMRLPGGEFEGESFKIKMVLSR